MKILDSKGTKICGTLKMDCCKKYEKYFYSSEDLDRCDCLSSCSSLSYDAYASSTDFDFGRTLSHTIYRNDFDLEK